MEEILSINKLSKRFGSIKAVDQHEIFRVKPRWRYL